MQNVVVFMVMLAGSCGGIVDGWPEGWLALACVGWLLIWNVDGIARRRKTAL